MGGRTPESIVYCQSCREAASEEDAFGCRSGVSLQFCFVPDNHGREISVYALMLDGRTIAEIADELFITPSTVRAHISRIYEKFDVHSRQELLKRTRS